MQNQGNRDRKEIISRRNFLKLSMAGGALSAAAFTGTYLWQYDKYAASTFIASVKGYHDHLKKHLEIGLKEIGVSNADIKGKRVMLKPNLVEPHKGVGHINTHPLVVQAAIETFYALGAAEVFVAEGSGHRSDALLIVEESGLAEVLKEDKVRFVDLNKADIFAVNNQGTRTGFTHLLLPVDILTADVIVSLAKMKTHHWVGATLTMKNLFGLLPGAYYGWPKNVLHAAGITESILDINATIQPQIAIVDGIVGMEGDGPIMGTPAKSGVLVMGRTLPAVDATCARIMDLDPLKIEYLKAAADSMGPIDEALIEQRGEKIDQVRRPYALVDTIPVYQGLRLS